MAKKKTYDESAVKTMDALSHIRLRCGMYIGRIGDGSHIDDGIYILMKEVIDNSIDEFIMHHGTKIEISFDPLSSQISVRDWGRGIPLGKVIDCVSEINTGAKYNDDVFQFSVGLNGVGLKAVNALSSHFLVQSFRNGKMFEARFRKGKLIESQEKKTNQATGTFVTFIPDKEIFKKFQFQEEFIRKRLWHYAYLNRGLKLIYNGEPFYSENGLLDLLNQEVPDEEKLYEPLHYRGNRLEFALLHTQSYGESYFSFVNGQYTADGGTHLSAFREGLLKGVNEFAKKNFQGVDVREGIVGCILVKVENPVFESQTKVKLSNTELRSPLVQEVKEAVFQLLHQHPSAAGKLCERIAFNEKLRKELAAVKKEAKEKQKKISFKIPKLRDCKFHLNESPHGEETMIFLTEGESASASIVSSRDPLRQAVFSLRGKPVNVHGMKIDQLYKNEEMFNLMSALNVEDDISGLRYNKVILATDADVDGMHIRNLLITFFLTYFEGLVLNGHLHVLETPIFKVRNKEKTLYCYSEEEKEEAIQSLKAKNVEITRFKGLGEISPHEFKQFIGPSMRLKAVIVHSFADIKPTLQFYMGKNTPERRNFIMENLRDAPWMI